MFVPAHFSSRISSVSDDSIVLLPPRPRLLFPELDRRFVLRAVSPFEATFEMQHSNPAPFPLSLPALNRRSPCSARNTTPLEYITSLHFPEFSLSEGEGEKRGAKENDQRRLRCYLSLRCTHSAFCIIASRSLFSWAPKPKFKDHGRRRRRWNGQLESLRGTDRF